MSSEAVTAAVDGQKRVLVNRACNECRRLKRKCEASKTDLTRCAACVARGRDCVGFERAEPSQSLSTHGPQQGVVDQIYAASVRLVLASDCLQCARITPGRLMLYSGAMQVAVWLKANAGSIDGLPDEMLGVARQLMVFGQRSNRQLQGDALEASVQPIERKIAELYETRTLAPPATLVDVASEMLYVHIATLSGADRNTQITALRRTMASILNYAATEAPGAVGPDRLPNGRFYPAVHACVMDALSCYHLDTDLIWTKAHLEDIFCSKSARTMSSRPQLDHFQAAIFNRDENDARQFFYNARAFFISVARWAAEKLLSRRARRRAFDWEAYEHSISILDFLHHTDESTSQINIAFGRQKTATAQDDLSPETPGIVDATTLYSAFIASGRLTHADGHVTRDALAILVYSQIGYRIERSAEEDDSARLLAAYPDAIAQATYYSKRLIGALRDLSYARMPVGFSMARLCAHYCWQPLLDNVLTGPYTDEERRQHLYWLRSAQADHCESFPRSQQPTLDALDAAIASLSI